MKKVIILYTEAGGGHKMTAVSLQEIICKETTWKVQLINPYKDVCEELDLLKKVFAISSEDLYNKIVSSKNIAFFNLLLISIIFHLNLKFYHNKIVKRFHELWVETNPDIIISVTPFINKLVCESIAKYANTIPFVTIVTDYEECVKDLWLVDKQQYVICASDQLKKQALHRGIPESRIFKISGMIIHPKFYAVMAESKQSLRIKLGLKANLPTGLVMFGSHGAKDMHKIAIAMRNYQDPIQLIFICGKDVKLANDLQSLQVDYPLVSLGFVQNVEQYMRCADFFISKPGGISISEAAFINLPMIIKYGALTLLQERYNARWIIANGLGISVKNFSNIQNDIKYLLTNIDYYLKNLSLLNNRGAFELIEILSHLLK